MQMETTNCNVRECVEGAISQQVQHNARLCVSVEMKISAEQWSMAKRQQLDNWDAVRFVCIAVSM